MVVDWNWRLLEGVVWQSFHMILGYMVSSHMAGQFFMNGGFIGKSANDLSMFHCHV